MQLAVICEGDPGTAVWDVPLAVVRVCVCVCGRAACVCVGARRVCVCQIILLNLISCLQESGGAVRDLPERFSSPQTSTSLTH